MSYLKTVLPKLLSKDGKSVEVNVAGTLGAIFQVLRIVTKKEFNAIG